ncbi:MAG: MurT ligase domain-containing protein [Thermomicrobiales bacterium]
MASTRPDPRLAVAVTAAKGISVASRRLGRGGGTAAPGLVADRIDPQLLGKIASQLTRGAIVVAGTNGKTTTSRIIADVLEADGAKVVHNRSGSNLVRGVAAAFAESSSYLGRPNGDVGVIEADEAAFPEIVRRVKPRVVLPNNLFRDQLDRYGELHTIATMWKPALASLPPTSTVVVNVDDPALAVLTENLAAKRITFGMRDIEYRLDNIPHAADSIRCPKCDTALEYDALYLSHLGAWRCPNCGTKRPELDVGGESLLLNGVESLTMTIAEAGAGAWPLEIGVPGLYNAYNALAASAVSRAIGVNPPIISKTMAAFRSAFGRIERLIYRNRNITIALVKNPVGFNEVLRMLVPDGELKVPALIAINDLAADGRDVSWLWDVDFELLGGVGAKLATAGIRGTDMANRLKYAGVEVDRISSLGTDLDRALDAFVDLVPEGETAYILPTYTAMLDIRRILAGRGAIGKFWEQ